MKSELSEEDRRSESVRWEIAQLRKTNEKLFQTSKNISYLLIGVLCFVASHFVNQFLSQFD